MSEPVSSHDHGNCALCDQLERELAEARAEMERRDREGAESLAMAGGCVEDLQTKLAAAEQRERALRDELARRGFHATERAPCPQCLDALALTPPGPSVER